MSSTPSLDRAESSKYTSWGRMLLAVDPRVMQKVGPVLTGERLMQEFRFADIDESRNADVQNCVYCIKIGLLISKSCNFGMMF